MEGLSITDVMERVKSVNGHTTVPAASDNAPAKQVKVSLEKALCSIASPRDREIAEAMFQKELRSPDLAQLRLISLAQKNIELRNTQTVFLNIVEANPVQRVTDFQVRFRERKIGEDTASFFNPNDVFAGEANTNRPMRDNTLGFLGNKIMIRIIAEEIASQSSVEAVNLLQQEVEFELTRIRRGINSALLSNTEVKAENVGNTPQWGGFINRSTLYNLGTSGDLTNGLIQGRIDAIANAADAQGLGYNIPLIALCRAGQIAKIEDLMIARWPGSNSVAMQQTMSEMLAKLQDVGIAPDQMVAYKPRPGRPILFIYEPMLPSGNCVFFDPTLPQLGRFQMMGAYGPWVLERPTENITRIFYMFDAVTLLDHLVESRGLITGLNN